MTTPTDADIDSDLTMSGFDLSERYPEYGHEALREAYRAGFDAGVVHERAEMIASGFSTARCRVPGHPA